MKDGCKRVPAGKIATVVTHLEMRAPPDTGVVPLPGGVVADEGPFDTGRYRDLHRRVGTEWLWSDRLKLSDEELGAIIFDPKVEICTLRLDNRDEALMELDFRRNGTCELAYFGLTRALIGTGAGRALMAMATARALAAGIERFTVHTCTLDSPQALGFYRKSGFTPVYQEVEIVDDPRLTGLLPEDAAPRIPLYRS